MLFILPCFFVFLVSGIIANDFIRFCVTAVAGCLIVAIIFGLCGYWDSPSNSNANVSQNTVSNAVSDTVNKDQLYGNFPRTFPNDHGKEDSKWWHDWAVWNTNGDPVICRDGIQIVVNGVENTDGGASSISERTRVHPDGKPFTCNESKDPTEEVHS
jgi:hypothetical protein